MNRYSGGCAGWGLAAIADGGRAVVGPARAHAAQQRSRGGARARPRARRRAVYGEARLVGAAMVFAGCDSHALGIGGMLGCPPQPTAPGPDHARADHPRSSAGDWVTTKEARPRPAPSVPAGSGSQIPGTASTEAPAAGTASVSAAPQGNTAPWPRIQVN